MNQKKEKNKNKGAKSVSSDIIDEKKDPCLRALQKKIRNINKKLNEIADLETKKKDLKPEQL